MRSHSNCFLKTTDIVSSGLTRKRTIQVVTSAKFKRQHLWWCGGVLVPMAWITCTSVKATLMPKGTNRFWSNICCQPDKVFFTNIPAYNDKQHSADVRTGWLRSKRLLNWPACSPDLPSTESVWCIVKCKIQRRRPHWATNTSGNWCPQFPNTYWVLQKEELIQHSDKQASESNFLGMCCRQQIHNGCNKKKYIKWICLEIKYFVSDVYSN